MHQVQYYTVIAALDWLHLSAVFTGAGMLMSSALFRQASYDDVVNWIWSLGDISSGGMLVPAA